MMLHDSIKTDHLSNPLDKRSCNIVKFGTLGTYTLGSLALYEFWYKDFEQESFHFFNDLGEWSNVDKMGHIQASYFQSHLIYKSYKWCGLSDDKAIWWSSLSSLGFQTAIEVMDGFSSGWGFSISDYAANVIGVSTFALQQRYWQEQKIQFKMSYWPENYTVTPISPTSSLSIKDRANELFGNNLPQQFLKDYNAQTYWLSFHPSLIFPKFNKLEWLNISLGYGAENMLGGFTNQWTNDGVFYELENQRYKQFVIALDYDLAKIKTKSRFLRTVLDVLNIFKWPAPGIEFTSEGEIKFHLLFLN